MSAELNPAYDYQVGGSLPPNAPSYVTRQADDDLYYSVKAGQFCYVLNSRQVGKSSLRVRTMQRLREAGIACVAIDITAIGARDISPEQWYAGIIDSIVSSLELFDSFNLEEWWVNHSRLSNITRFSKFIEEVLLKLIPKNLVIFVDEIDSILRLSFNIDDFFAFIRKCYNSRADNLDYRRLTFALIGVATPSDLIQDKRCTPFNVGRPIELTGFQLSEAQPLALGLAKVADNPEALLQAVLDWTGGQPFLTQKVCQLIRLAEAPISTGREQEWVEELVRSRLIYHWEAQDEPEHLRTIRTRLLQREQRTVKLLGLYQQILQQGEIVANDSPEQTELRLSGLVVKQDGKLRIYNRIYQSIFQLNWVEEALCNLRPYAKQLAAWEASHRKEVSHLLGGQELQDALAWSTDKSLSDQDYQFLTASQQKANEILNQIVWELVSPLCVDEISPQLETILDRLRQVSGDDSLTLLHIKAGSTILVLQGSQEGLERIRSLLSTGQLSEILGIPIQDVRYIADAIALTPSSPIPNPKASVLIVDDNPDLRTYVSHILQRENYQVWTASNGDEGLRVAQEWRPNLILTNLMMPLVSGVDMIRMIRTSTELRGTPIILLTPQSAEATRIEKQHTVHLEGSASTFEADAVTRIERTQTGADAYLSTPFNNRELLAEVRNLLALKENEQRVAVLNTYLTELVLKRFLPPSTVQKATRGEIELDLMPEPRLITILSSGMVSFNQLANTLRSRRVAALLNEYLQAMIQAVFDHGGTFDKFVGDTIVAIFGAPEELTPNQQVQQALAAARQMRRSLKELNQCWQEQGLIGVNSLHSLQLRCGIHQGVAVVGMFGSQERSDYTAIGPSLNVASWLQEAAEPNSILVSATVADFLDDDVITKGRPVVLKVGGTFLTFAVKPEWLEANSI